MSVTASCAGRRRWRRPNGWRGSACRYRALCRAICRPERRSAPTARRVASSAAAHWREGNTLTQPELAAHAGRDPPARRRRFLPGSARRARCPSRSRRWAAACRSRRCAPRCRRPARRCRRELWQRRRVYVAPAPAAGASALAGWKGQAPSGPTPADSGGFAGLAAVDGKAGAAACSPVDGPDSSARAPSCPASASCWARRSPQAGSVSPVIIANPGNGEFAFVGAGGGAATAAQATGYVRVRHHRQRPAAGQRAGVACAARAAGSTPSPVPSGLRSSGSSCRSAIDPAGAGLALIASR